MTPLWCPILNCCRSRDPGMHLRGLRDVPNGLAVVPVGAGFSASPDGMPLTNERHRSSGDVLTFPPEETTQPAGTAHPRIR